MSAVSILERLLDEQSITSKEHVLDTASRHVSNVEDRFVEQYDKLVHEITAIWGAPQFNSTVPGQEEKNEEDEPDDEADQRTTQDGTQQSITLNGLQQSTTLGGERKRRKLRNVVPPWSNGTATNGGDIRAIRLCYWKRPTCVGYVALRKEIDKVRGIPLMYIIVLGARRRGPDAGRNVQALRQEAKPQWFRPIFNWLIGR